MYIYIYIYIYYNEERDGAIHEGRQDDSIEEFKKSMLNQYEKVDPSPDIICC